MDDGDAIAQRLCFAQVVRRQQYGLAVTLHLHDFAVQLAPRMRIEPGSWFVEEDELRRVDEREREGETLALAARERVECRVGLVGQGEAFEQDGGIGATLVKRSEERQRLPRRDLVLERGRLQCRADFLFDLARPAPRVDPAHFDRAVVGLAQPDDALDSRRLAGAVRSQEPEDLAVADLEAHAARRFDPAV